MKRLELLPVVGLLALAGTASGQVTTRIESHGSSMVATVWRASSSPLATALLIPGWGGGPTDVLGIARALSEARVSAVTLTPRGWHESEGTATFANALEDIAAALAWIREPGHAARFGLTPDRVVLGGHSWGGGMSLAYAARDSSVRRVFSVAGTDHAQFVRHYESDPEFAAMVDQLLTESAAPNGPIRFNVDSTLDELKRGQKVYGLVENASRLADRSILLIGGWEDENVTIDDTLLPLYRALRAAGAEDVTFKTYHADHSFRTVRDQLHRDLIDWIER